MFGNLKDVSSKPQGFCEQNWRFSKDLGSKLGKRQRFGQENNWRVSAAGRTKHFSLHFGPFWRVYLWWGHFIRVPSILHFLWSIGDDCDLVRRLYIDLPSIHQTLGKGHLWLRITFPRGRWTQRTSNTFEKQWRAEQNRLGVAVFDWINLQGGRWPMANFTRGPWDSVQTNEFPMRSNKRDDIALMKLTMARRLARELYPY